MTASELFQSLWSDYTQRLCPSAENVHQRLQEATPLINDHIALRTFSFTPLGVDTLAKPFLDLGYTACGDYYFEKKKLTAKHYQHPDLSQPKVFISQLEVNQCSDTLQAIVMPLREVIDRQALEGSEFLSSGRLWSASYQNYQRLAQESEYAAWLYAHGYGANHFTVSINHLNRFFSVKTLNAYLRESGFVINEAGGEVKGSPEVMLEQSSTMADTVPVTFSDGVYTIPGGFYEFALRYPMEDGQLYQGFVEASADRIFESTHRQ